MIGIYQRDLFQIYRNRKGRKNSKKLIALTATVGGAVAVVACGRRCGLMVSALDSGASGPGSSPDRGHSVEFLGKTLNSYSASLRWTSIPSRGE